MRIAVVPSIWFVGFSGHRRVQDPEKILGLLTAELQKLRGQAASHLVGIASAAIGADQLFLQACRAEAIPYEVLFPFPEEEFKKDFEDADWQRTLDLCATALKVRQGDANETRPKGYLTCGVEVVDQCDVLVVVWNGLEAAGVGGTTEIVDYARRLERPLIWIHSETYEVKTENLPENPFQDKTIASMRKCLGPESAGTEPAETTPREAVERLFAKADEYATRTAPAARGMAAGMVLLNLVVSILSCASALAALGPPHSWLRTQSVLNVTRFVLFVFVFGVAASKLMKVRHSQWLICRFAAEVCRSILATWELPVEPSLTSDGGPSEFAHLLRTLSFLRSISADAPKEPDPAVLKRYVEKRIGEQIDHYRNKSAGLAPREKSLRTVFLISMILTALLMVGLMITPLLWHWVHNMGLYKNVATQLLSLTPMIATSALSLIYVYEYQRRIVQYERMIRLLTRYRAQILASPGGASLGAHITRCEHTLVGEVQDWYYYGLYGK